MGDYEVRMYRGTCSGKSWWEGGAAAEQEQGAHFLWHVLCTLYISALASAELIVRGEHGPFLPLADSPPLDPLLRTIRWFYSKVPVLCITQQRNVLDTAAIMINWLARRATYVECTRTLLTRQPQIETHRVLMLYYYVVHANPLYVLHGR